MLRSRDTVGGALFWLFPNEGKYPSLAIRVSTDVADVHYFPHKGHAGFRALADASVLKDKPRILIYEGCDPATGEETPGEFVLPVSVAIDLAKEFHRTGERSSAVEWFEL